MKIGIYVNPTKKEATSALQTIITELKKHGMTYLLDVEAGELIGETGSPNFFENVDLVLSLGGDGTMLECVHRMEGHFHVPIAGVNIGTLGFLTTCTDENFADYAKHLANDGLRSVCIDIIEVEMKEIDKGVQKFWALNEVTLMRGLTGRLVVIEAEIDGQDLTEYHADGLIVATPTGSTAYSLAAGGPIIAPGSGVFVVNPICPHTMSNRALVVPNTSVITLKADDKEPIRFTADGRAVLKLDTSYPVTIKSAEQKLQLLQMPNSTYYEKLRSKLGWAGGLNQLPTCEERS